MFYGLFSTHTKPASWIPFKFNFFFLLLLFSFSSFFFFFCRFGRCYTEIMDLCFRRNWYHRNLNNITSYLISLCLCACGFHFVEHDLGGNIERFENFSTANSVIFTWEFKNKPTLHKQNFGETHTHTHTHGSPIKAEATELGGGREREKKGEIESVHSILL